MIIKYGLYVFLDLTSSKTKNLSSSKNLNYFSTFSENADTKTKSEKDLSGFNEVQAAISKQWNDWKKFQAFPVDDDEETGSDLLDSDTNLSIPKMVLVEVDGVRMFYPSCYIGILADQMIFDRKNCRMTTGSNNSSKNATAATSSNSQNPPATAFAELDLSFGEESDTRNNVNCAEDHEVEEILNSHITNGGLSNQIGSAGIDY